MAKKVKLIIGEINFNDATEPQNSEAIITKVDGIFFCDNVKSAEKLGEILISEIYYLNSYIVPDLYKGKIVCVCNRKTKQLIDFEL